jgi:hypothetical protein
LQKKHTKNFNIDLNSPEGIGLSNTPETRSDGSSEAFITNFYNMSNVTIATRILLPGMRLKFYTHNPNILLQKEAAERFKNQFLLPILDPEVAPANFSLHSHL